MNEQLEYIPDLTGLTEFEARAILEQNSFRVGKVRLGGPWIPSVGSVRLAGPWYKRLWFKVRRVFK